APEINTWVSLLVIVAAMAVSTLASLIRMRSERVSADA
ncbi:TerC family protein, partial [Curtobacterium sp. MCSS17_011]